MDEFENKKNFTMNDLCSFKLDFKKEIPMIENEKKYNENIKQVNNSILNNKYYKNTNHSRFTFEGTNLHHIINNYNNNNLNNKRYVKNLNNSLNMNIIRLQSFNNKFIFNKKEF